MSAFIISIILMTVVILICMIALALDNKKAKEKEDRLRRRFSWLGSEHAFRFSSQDRLKNAIIGLDGIHRRLLLMMHDKKGNKSSSQVIDLAEVSRCRMKKIYRQQAGAAGQPEKIVLHFERENKPPAEIVFFHYAENEPHELPVLEKKASHWEAMLTKMLRHDARKIA